MAFHPFQFFRKRQKTFLAALTILSMFIFILTGVSGDVTQRLSSWLAGRTNKDKTEVTPLYGSTVTAGELDQLRRDRLLANTFIQRAMESAATNYIPEPEVRQRMQEIILRNPFAQMDPSMIRQGLFRYQQELLKANKNEAARYVAFENGIIGLRLWQQSHPASLYFGGTLAPDDLLDHLLWRHQADRLGITLTDDDVVKAINSEAGGEVLTGNSVKDEPALRRLLQGVREAVSIKGVYDILRDEFRVRLAQQVLLGSGTGARSALGPGLVSDEVPAGATPEQFWDFYKDNRTELKAAFLKVPVSQFTGEVKVPAEDDKEAYAKYQQALQDLYRRYKDEEPNPERERPGFKVPRKVKVEWVSADPSAPHYREEAAQAQKVLAGAGAVADALAGAGSPGGVPAAASALAVALTPDLPLLAEYESYVRGVRSLWDAKSVMSWWDTSGLVPEGMNPYAGGLRRPDTVAAVVGQALGTAATGGTAWGVPGVLAGETTGQLTEQNVRAASMALAGSSPTVLGALAQEAAFTAVPVRPLSAVREDLAARARERLTPELAQGALDTFTKELDAKRFNPKDAAEYVQKNANPEHGITAHEVMAEPRDQTDVAEAPALAALRHAAEGQVPLTPSRLRDFAGTFFRANLLYHPERFGNPSGALYYYWLTQSDKAYVPSFEEARPKVEAAWKFQQARDLARQEADRIAAEAQKKFKEGITPERFLADEAARHPGFEEFEPPSISKLVPDPHAFLSGATQYKPYQFDESRIAYPKADSVAELFKRLTEPGSATVIEDRPRRNYYVAALKERVVPTEKQFIEVYEKAPRGALFGDTLWARFQGEREEQFRTALVRQFRKEAGAKLDNQDNYEIDPEVRKRLGGRGGSEE